MIESIGESPQSSIRDLRFKIAGWFSIYVGIFEIPLFIFSLFARSDPSLKPVLLYTAFLPLILIRWVCVVYALIQFRRLLNERYGFYKADVIITIQIVVSVITCVKDILMNNLEALFPLSDLTSGLGGALYIFSLLVDGTVGIFLGATLLAIREDPYGSLRLYAVITIISSSCLLTILLLPVAGLLFLVGSVILGIIFLKAGDSEPQVDFV